MPRSRRSCLLVACAIGFAGAWAAPAAAQHPVPIDSPEIVNGPFIALLSTSEPFVRIAPPRIDGVAPMPALRAERAVLRRPAALPALYGSFAALQALDVHSTIKAVGAGESEANPAVRGLVRQPAAFVAAKVAATAATFYASERLWRRHRVGAVMLMVAVNGAYAAIVANNYRR
jgi:hypothetical protein